VKGQESAVKIRLFLEIVIETYTVRDTSISLLACFPAGTWLNIAEMAKRIAKLNPVKPSGYYTYHLL
jgi:hypothetical protein